MATTQYPSQNPGRSSFETSGWAASESPGGSS